MIIRSRIRSGPSCQTERLEFTVHLRAIDSGGVRRTTRRRTTDPSGTCDMRAANSRTSWCDLEVRQGSNGII
jgi:hypothetical protein